jgi:hypothetical protein
VGRGVHGAGRLALDCNRARLHEPLRHLVLDEGSELFQLKRTLVPRRCGAARRACEAIRG